MGTQPGAVVARDFNYDGKIDLVTANYASADLAVLLGNGDGTFQPARLYAEDQLLFATDIAVGDFNSDDLLDLAVSQGKVDRVRIMPGNADGSFEVGTILQGFGDPEKVVTSDFNGDAKLDLAVGNAEGPNVAVLLGNGDGTFQPIVNYPTGLTAFAIAANDFNHDDYQDLAVTDALTDTVFILLGNGDGTFQAGIPYATGFEPMTIAVDDFNSDGALDLAIGSGSGLAVLLGNGDGTFQPKIDQPLDHPSKIGDINEDGRPDIVTFGRIASPISIGLSNGDGTFRNAFTYAAGGGTMDVAVTDFNGDLLTDFAAANFDSDTVSIFIGKGDGEFDASPVYLSSHIGDVSLLANDFNFDAVLDLAITNPYTDNVSILLGNPDGSFQSELTTSTGDQPRSLSSKDFNSDSKPDLAVVNENDDTVTISLGRGDGTFDQPAPFATGDAPESLQSNDFNGDGIQDLVVANRDSSNVSILLGKGDGSFQAAKNFGAGAKPVFVTAGELTGDTALDLAVANSGGNHLSMLRGNGDGTFGAPERIMLSGLNPVYIAVADLNRDQFADLIVANSTTDNISVLLGHGDGTFEAPATYFVGRLPLWIQTADFDRDSIVDVAVAAEHSHSIVLLIGNGDGTFQPAEFFASPSPLAIVSGDFDQDGILDLAAIKVYFTIQILFGQFSISLTPPTLPSAQVDAVYYQQLSAVNGVAPFSFSIAYGNLPPGLVLDPSGFISGTPVQAGSFLFAIRVTDSEGCSRVREYALVVKPACPTITVDPPQLPDGTPGALYNATLTASGGSAPYVYTVTCGALPTGLNMDSAGHINGIPDDLGAFNFCVTVTDSNGCSTTENYAINIACIFCDDFEDGALATNWIYPTGKWVESGGTLQGRSRLKTAKAYATPVFGGCSICTVQSQVKVRPSISSRISLVGWYQDEENFVELIMKENTNRWILKQRISGRIVAKEAAASSIQPNTYYDARITFDGNNFQVLIDGSLILTMPKAAGSVPTGSVGFRTKEATGYFQNISVN